MSTTGDPAHPANLTNDMSGIGAADAPSDEKTAYTGDRPDPKGVSYEAVVPKSTEEPVGSRAADTVEESVARSARPGLAALAFLREHLVEKGLASGLQHVLSVLERELRAPRPEFGHNDDHEPGSTRRRLVARTTSNEDDGSEPPTSSAPPPALSRFAVRDDGALLMSLEDAANRDVTGRQVIAFVVLTPEEAESAREAAHDALSGCVAHIIALLPKKAP